MLFSVEETSSPSSYLVGHHRVMDITTIWWDLFVFIFLSNVPSGAEKSEKGTLLFSSACDQILYGTFIFLSSFSSTSFFPLNFSSGHLTISLIKLAETGLRAYKLFIFAFPFWFTHLSEQLSSRFVAPYFPFLPQGWSPLLICTHLRTQPGLLMMV